MSLLVLMVAGTAAPVAATPQPQPRLAGNARVVFITKDGLNALLVSGPKRVDKLTYDHTADARAAGVVLKAKPLGDWYLSNDVNQPALGSSLESYLNTHISGGCGLTCDFDLNGDSHVFWWGTPYYADAVQMTETFNVYGCVVTVSASGPGLFTSGGRANFDSGWIGPEWRINHYYSIHASSWCGINSADQTTTGNMRMGSDYYTASASDSVFFW